MLGKTRTHCLGDAGERGVGVHLTEGAAAEGEWGAAGFEDHRLFDAVLPTMGLIVVLFVILYSVVVSWLGGQSRGGC